MSFWELHRRQLYVLGGLLVLLFLAWLFLLRGWRQREEAAEAAYSEMKAEIQALCPPDRGIKFSELIREYTTANTELTTAIDEMITALNMEFTSPIIPAEHQSRYGIYVRNKKTELQDYIAREFETKRNVELTPSVLVLGFEMPDDMDEPLETAQLWTRQMQVAYRFIKNVLLPLPESRDGVRPVAKILRFEPFLPPQKVGGSREDLADFLREYPMELELEITLPGLMRLLAACSERESFHVIQHMRIESGPGQRVSDLYTQEDRAANIRTRFYGHYYRVYLRVAALEALDEDEIKAPSTTRPTGPRTPKTPWIRL